MPRDVHMIRLRGPWRLEPVSRTRWSDSSGSQDEPGPVPPPARGAIGTSWHDSLGAFRGRVRYRRSFHAPTGITAGVRVWLVLTGFSHAARLTLDDHPLGAFTARDAPLRLDITDRLAPTCRLAIEIDAPAGAASPAPPGLTGEVWLEIGEGNTEHG